MITRTIRSRFEHEVGGTVEGCTILEKRTVIPPVQAERRRGVYEYLVEEPPTPMTSVVPGNPDLIDTVRVDLCPSILAHPRIRSLVRDLLGLLPKPCSPHQPANASMLELRALLYEQAGDLLQAAAAAAVDAALGEPWARAPDGGKMIADPPDFLVQLKTRLWASYAASLAQH